MSKCIINVGGTGSGKTTGTKEILSWSKKPQIIFDINGEYPNGLRGYEFKKFIDVAYTARNSQIVFEEATIFFSHSGSTEKIKSILVRKRHTNNTLIFNFHSLRQVPLFILDFCDYIIIRKTVDNPRNIQTKFEDFEDIYTAYEDVRNSIDKYENTVVNLR